MRAVHDMGGNLDPRFAGPIDPDDHDRADWEKRVDAMAMVGVPYGDALNRAPAMAREQAKTMAAAIVEQGGPRGLEDKQIVAIVAYMQRLGRDIKVQSTAAKGAQ